MELTTIFINNLSYIKIKDKRFNPYYEFKKEIKLFFGLIYWREEGFYYYWDRYEPTSLSDLKKEHLIIDKEVYIKPCIVFGTNCGEIFEKYFDSIEDCYKFVEEKGLNKINHIEIN